MNLDSTAIVAIAAVASAFITLLSNWVKGRGKVSELKAEGDTALRRSEAKSEVEAVRMINKVLDKTISDLEASRKHNAELQRALLTNNKTLTDFMDMLTKMIEKQTALFEKLITLLSKGVPPS